MGENKLCINEDITDWRDEAMREEIAISGKRSAVAEIKAGRSTAQVARASIVNRELGYLVDDFLRSNKILLMAAAMQDVAQAVKSETMIDVETGAGRVYKVPGVVGRIGRPNALADYTDVDEQSNEEPDDFDTGPSYVPITDPLAIERAERYLLNVVPGHIWRRLLVILANDGDVEEAAELIKEKIDEMVRRLR